MTRTAAEIDALTRRVKEITSWYHAIDLGDGVETPGPFRMRDFLSDYDFERLEGARVLDVGASNGFFACHFEKLGAKEVIALDLPSWGAHDWTPRYLRSFAAKRAEERDYIDRQVMRAGFDLVCEALGCRRVRKLEMTIYDITPETLGTFDLVFSGSMLMHVRDPILGLQRLRSVCKDTGKLTVSISTFDDSDQPVARFVGKWDECQWWQMNPACLKEVLRCCDFEPLGPGKRFVLTDKSGQFKDPTFVVHARPMPAAPAAGSSV
jgi:SAM-dependent methyltransferase